MTRSLDDKLADIQANPSGSRAFILADARDADMAFGIGAPGSGRTMDQFREEIRQVVRQGIVDIMLLSASNLEMLAMEERLFEGSTVTPAARANDATDIWAGRGSAYTKRPSVPFRTATLEHIMYGRLDTAPGTLVSGADLGLYSITFTNDLEADLATLNAFRAFRLEAEQAGFRYFLEVFNPNVPIGIPEADVPAFVNDNIVRALAGVTRRGMPLFLKVAYNGPRALEELVGYDSRLIIGILGGSAGTTYDAFRLVADVQKYGARAALFGRKIKEADHPLAFIEFLRRIVDGEIGPEEAVRAYHGELQARGIRPRRALEKDLQLTGAMRHYAKQ